MFSFFLSFFLSFVSPLQCDQIGQFLKLSATKFLAKEAQMIGNFLGYFDKSHSNVKTALTTFWATFGKIGLLFTPTSGHTGPMLCTTFVTFFLRVSFSITNSFGQRNKMQTF